ncbi:MAG: hypothetical protein R2877_07085 [Bdellovibrionota bacterium]
MGLDMTTTHATTAEDLIFPPQSNGLSAYANSIQGIQCFQSMGGHTENFNSTYMAGSVS